MTTYTTGSFGPNLEHVDRLLEDLEGMTQEQAETVSDAWDYPVSFALEEVRSVARKRGRDVSWGAITSEVRSSVGASKVNADSDDAGDATWCAIFAAHALTVRDLIPQEVYDAATRPLRLAGFTIHPDDKELR